MTTPDHAAALAKLSDHRAPMYVTTAHREFAALYRAGVELRAAALAYHSDKSHAAYERHHAAVLAMDAALAAVADKLTKGEGK